MPVLALLSAAFFWGMIGPISKYTFLSGISPMEAAFWRSTIAGICFGVHAAFNKTLRVDRQDWIPLILFTIFGVAGLESTFLLSVNRIGGALASVLLYSAPAWVAVFSTLFLGEKMTTARWIALILILTGVSGACFSLPGPIRLNALGIFFGLVSGLSYAFFYLFGKKYFHKYQAPNLYFYAFVFGGMVMLPAVQFHEKTIGTWTIFIMLGFFSTYLAYFLYSLGLKKMDATRASLITSLEPIISITLSFVLWHEPITSITLFFSALVILGSLRMALE